MKILKTGTTREYNLRRKNGNMPRVKVQTSKCIYKLLVDYYNTDSFECQEEFHAIYFDRNNTTVGHSFISKGGVSATVVDPRLIFIAAIEFMASAIVLSHNHPSGSMKPSQVDIELTRKLIEGGKALDIQVIDHIIMADMEGSYYSFMDEGLMPIR